MNKFRLQLSYTDGLGDKSPFVTTELLQLAVYGEQ